MTNSNNGSRVSVEDVQQYLELSGISKLSSRTFKNIVLSLPIDKDAYSLGTQFGDVIVNTDGFKELSMGTNLLTLKDNEEVYACYEGTVVFVGDDADGLGDKVVVEDTKSGLGFVYASLIGIKLNVGDRVSANNVIGYTSRNTYLKTPHLHLEIYDTQTGNRYDPEKFSYR